MRNEINNTNRTALVISVLKYVTIFWLGNKVLNIVWLYLKLQ